MESKNHVWYLDEVMQETKDSITIRFNTGGKPFKYLAGQFVNVAFIIDGDVVTRSYSLTSSPNEPHPSITVKRVAGGVMSNYLLDHAHDISEWEIEGPYGNFTLSSPIEQDKLFCFLGGGSGITPLFSIMKALKEEARPFYLVYANRNEHDVIFKDVIGELVKDGNANVFHALTGEVSSDAYGEDLYNGRLNKLIVKKLIKQRFDEPENVLYYICGPEKLMEVYKESLISLAVSEEQIFMENFSVDDKSTNEASLPSEPHEVLMHVYESTNLINVKAGQSILDAALDNGVSIKYSCKNGTCGSCWGWHSEGVVTMIKNYALTKEEVENNYILLCQTYPMNNQVTVHVG
ncbi:MAG: iron-sulfur cluster-binding domain-containing protein [Chitinophagaceae bacterium]|nr:MAG: iron-sulfur cluster-binding domain-containing protein [Chitinophagaceae bacterium]